MFKLFMLLFLFVVSAHGDLWPSEKPPLVVFIVIDQFRADYLSRYQNKFRPDGFKLLMKSGAYFPFAEYDVLQCMTAPGHATVLTGAYPYQMGIPVNDWYDQKKHDFMYCVDDKSTEIVGLEEGSKSGGMSPKNLNGSTVGDELKNSGIPSRMISIALKDRAAILMGGHRADLALWNDLDSGRWISSKYYLKDGKLPKWVEDLNSKMPKTHCEWQNVCGVEKTVQAFKGALENYKLGQGKTSDIISLSFSSHDYAGHRFGPNSKEIEVITQAEDRAISEMLRAVKEKVPGGLKNALFILTGDHGVAPMVKDILPEGIDAGRMDEKLLENEAEEILTEHFGKPKNKKWITHVVDFNFYFDEEAAKESKISFEKIENDIKSVLLKNPGFAHVFTQTEYEDHKLPPLMFERQILKTFYKGRSGRVVGIPKSFYINETKNKATHLSSYSYDRTVPLLFYGRGVKPGVYGDRVEVVDIAPTLSFILGVVPPALSEGKVLKQILVNSK